MNIICFTKDSSTQSTPLRVMSFNILSNGGDSLAACAEAILLSNADIIGVQESIEETTRKLAKSIGFYQEGSVISR